MATIFNFLAATLLVACFISKGYCQCTLSDLAVSQSETGVKVKNEPERKVIVSNNCPCSQLDVKLACSGFQSAQPIDPSLLSKSGDECLVNNGNPIGPEATVEFNYVSNSEFPFEPLSSQIACS